MATAARKNHDEIELQDYESESDSGSGHGNRALFLDKVRESNEAIQRGDFQAAITHYTDAIELDPVNHILYSNRSAAYIKLEQFEKALADALKAKELDPSWPKAFYREGIALQCLGRFADALATFASGLTLEGKNTQLLAGLVDAVLKSPLKGRFQPTYQQLQAMKLDKNAFVIISVIGQDLLACNYHAASVSVLESSLRIGTCSLKLRGSVFSALSSAHWGLKNTDQAIAYMQQDLSVAKSLGDQEGECRTYGNLGSSYFSKGNYREALTNHRCQLRLAMKLKLRLTAATALSNLGHVYTAIGDYPNALASHKQCVLLVKNLSDKLWEAREIGNVGAVYTAMGDFNNALECHNEHLKIACESGNKMEEARALSNLGSAHHYNRDYDKAIEYHNQVLRISSEVNDKTLEARAYAGLGHAARAQNDLKKARGYHEKQLDNALQTKDKASEGRACSNIGIIYHKLGEYEAALKLHKKHLSIAKNLADRTSQGRAYGNIGNAYSALGQYDLAIKYHKQELALSKEVNDRHSEASTHGNLAVAYQALSLYEQALQHYNAHLNIARDLKDIASEARALSNVGNYYSVRGEFTQAIPFYMQFLQLSQELTDAEGEARACHCLGFAHYSLGSYREAIRYYDQDLALAKELKDQLTMARAHCNLGLAYKALGQYSQALEYQYNFLQITHSLKNVPGKFRAMGNIGDILINMQNMAEAVLLYNQQLKLAKQANDHSLEAAAYGALGVAHRITGQYDKALAFHTQELNLRQELSDLKGECKAHGYLGNVHAGLGNYIQAYKCYEEMLDRAKEVKDSNIEAQACGNLGITKMNMSQHEEAIGMFEQQLAMLEQVVGTIALLDKGRAFGNLGECYERLGDFEESVKCHEQYLVIAQNTGSLVDQDKAYRGLGNAHRSMGNLQQALVCFEKRLVVTHELDDNSHKGSAYGELGCLHSLLGNFDQAISCLEHQITLAKEQSDKIGEGDACCGLGGVYQQMGEYDRALDFHKRDLRIAQETNNLSAQCRAYGNLGLSYESQGDFQEALNHQEQHLSLAAEMSDRVAKTLAYSSLGRIHHSLGNYPQAVQYLRQGLQIAELLGRREDEAKIRHRLGLALWADGDLEESHHQLYKAAELFENIRREAHISSDYKLSLFDLQTASYQALQRVLVSLGRHEEALVVAERGRTRAFVDLLLERQTGGDGMYGAVDNAPVTVDQIMMTVNKAKSTVIYYSMAAGYLYSWLIVPEKGVVKFHECSVSELENSETDSDNISLMSGTVSLLDQYVGHVRESLGVETHLPSSGTSSRSSMRGGSGPSTSGVFSVSESESDAEDAFQHQLEEISGRLNAENDRTGFLRMVNRNQVFNSSNYSLSSLFSMSGSLNGFNLGASIRKSQQPSWSGRPPLSALYDLLISPMEEFLPQSSPNSQKELVLVLQGDLYLVPFAVLKGSKTNQYLYERYGLIVSPSLTALSDTTSGSRFSTGASGALVVGNPFLPSSIREQWHLSDLQSAEQEAKIVGEMVGVKPITGTGASKEAVLRNVPNTEVIHIAAHVSWKLSSIVLSPSEFVKPSSDQHYNMDELTESSSDSGSGFDTPSLAEYLLTAADILNAKLHCKLVVLSSGHTDDRAGRINSDGVVGLSRALLAAGARCVLFCLWPIPPEASKTFMKHFYTSLLQSHTASRALSDSMKKVQSIKQFSHPSNWAGWVLVGSDIKLSSKVALMGHALCEILQNSNRCRESLRVLLHLIEKSLQRIIQGEEKGMYTTQDSIESKVGSIPGWRDLLTSVGFRFEPGVNGMPPVVFFPLSDPGERLTQCSTSLQALLAMPRNALPPLAKLLHNYEAGEAIIQLLKELLSKNDTSSQLKMRVKLWRVTGCHEFLASLGFDLVDVGKDEVTVRTGKQASKRILQFAVQALIVLFNTQEGARVGLSSASSMESLNSSHSGSNTTTTSNFSKDSSTPHDSSTPPSSPHGKYYSPASTRMPAPRHGGYSSKNRLSNSSAQKSKSLITVPRSPRSAKYSSMSVDDAFRFGGPAGRFRAIEDEARVIGVDSDGTPTDDASSVSSLDTTTPTRSAKFTSRMSSRDESAYNTSSPSDSEGALSPLANSRMRSKITGPAMRRIERTRTPTRQTDRSTENIRNRASAGDNVRSRKTPESDSSDGSASSSRTMTGTSVKDPTSLAYKIMYDTKQEWQAVEMMQRQSIQSNKQETAKMRQQFEKKPIPVKLSSPITVECGDAKLPPTVVKPEPAKIRTPTREAVHSRQNAQEFTFDDMMPYNSMNELVSSPTASKPAVIPPPPAPKPKARPLEETTTKSIPTAMREPSSPTKKFGVRFSENMPTAKNLLPLPAYKPPPGYENDHKAEAPEEQSPNSPASEYGMPVAPPPYAFATKNSISDSEPSLPNGHYTGGKSLGSNHRRELSDSREQLVDNEEDLAYFENGGFDDLEDSGGFQATPDYMNTSSVSIIPLSTRPQLYAPKSNPPTSMRGQLPAQPKQSSTPALSTFKPSTARPHVNGIGTSASHMDYMNVFEDIPVPQEERYIGDVHNRFVEDLYPERVPPPFNGTGSSTLERNSDNNSPKPWKQNSATKLPFYMADGLKSSEC